MKKAVLAGLMIGLLLASCGESDSSSKAQEKQETSQSSSVSESQADEMTYKNVTNDPYELEKAINNSQSGGADYMVDDSETFETIDDMRGSVWAKFYAEKLGISKDKLTPAPKDGVEELGCTAHLMFYDLGYTYKGKKYHIQVGTRKFDDINKLYDDYFSEDGGYMLESKSHTIEGDIIIDEFDAYKNGYMILSLSSEGQEYQLYASDKDTTLDEMKEFAKVLDF